MIESIKKLMSYGMDFEYENMGSQGESINSFELGLSLRVTDGKILFRCSDINEEFEDTEQNHLLVSNKIESECIAQTASF